MLVVDASVVVPVLADDGDDGSRLRALVAGRSLAAPEIVDLEVASVLRRLVRRGLLTQERAVEAVRDLTDLPLQRSPHRQLLARCWELRENLTCYDAAYVALAEALAAELMTGDARLARAPGLRCRVHLAG